MFTRPRMFALLLVELLGVSTPTELPAQEIPPPPNVTPDGGTLGVKRVPANATGHSATFWIENLGTFSETYSLSCSRTGAVSSCSTPGSITVDAGQVKTVSVTFATGNPQLGNLSLTAGGWGGESDGFYTVTAYDATAPTSSTISIDATPHNGDYRDVTRCALDCFDAVASYATPAYVSMDVPRAVTVVYRSSQAKPMGFVQVDATDNSATPPEKMSIRLKRPDGTWVTFTNGSQEIFYWSGSGSSRLAAQFDAAGLGTGRHKYTVVARSWWGSSFNEATHPVRVLMVNESASPFGWGWSIPGFQRLHEQTDATVVITEGNGSIAWFDINTCPSTCSYFSPPGDFSTLTRRASWPDNIKWDRKYADGTKVAFYSDGRAVYVEDRFGNRTSFGYDGSNRLSTITDPVGKVVTLGYGADGKLDWIRDPGSPNRYTSVTINAAFDVTQVQDPAGGLPLPPSYDGQHRMTVRLDRRGGQWGFRHDFAHRLAADTLPTITAGGQSVRPVMTYNSLEAAVLVDPASGTGSFTTPAARILPANIRGRVIDPAAYTTSFAVDRSLQPLSVTDPFNRTTTYTRNAKGLPTVITYPSGGVDSITYGASDLPTRVRAAGRSATNIRYGAFAQPDSIWGDGQPGQRIFVNGTNGRIDSVRIGASSSTPGVVTRYTYDSRGRVVTTKDPKQHLLGQTWYTGVHENRSKDSLPGGRVTTYGYDAYGRRTTVSAPGRATVTTFYSIINRPDSVRDGVNAVATRYGYDALFLTSVTDSKGQGYGFSYNALGWLEQRTDPVGRAEQYAYSVDGLVNRWTNRRGQAIDYTYDALHRPTNKSGVNTATESWSYATDDRVVTATSPVVTETAYLNVAGQPDSVLTAMAGQTYRLRYVYTIGGLVDSVIPSGGGITTFQARNYVYNSRGTVTEIRLGTASTAIAPDADGLPESVTFPGGDQVTRDFYPLHSAAAITTSAPYELTTSRYLSFDAGGRIAPQILGTGIDGNAYTYDDLGRLKADSTIHYDDPTNPCEPPAVIDEDGNQCTYSGTWSTTGGVEFSYDAAGNRTDKGGLYETGNRITDFDSCTYDTDFDGNVTSRTCGAQAVPFTWTAENRLASYTLGGQTTSFEYTAGGRLVRKTTGAVVRHFLWEGDNLLAELDGAGTGKFAEYSYYPGLDNPHALIIGTDKHVAHQDGLGNVIALTDAAQGVSRTYAYEAWGALTGGSDNGNFAGKDRARFKGAQWVGEEVELYYMRARWYEPKSGRFLSEDPIGLEGGINLYTFAADDPVNHRDPTGLWCETQVKWVEGPEGSGWVEVLHCEDLSGGDLATIANYLGGYAGAFAERFLSALTGLGGGGSFASFGRQGQQAGPLFVFLADAQKPFEGCPRHVVTQIAPVRYWPQGPGPGRPLVLAALDVDVWRMRWIGRITAEYRGHIRAVTAAGVSFSGNVQGTVICSDGYGTFSPAP